MQLHVFPTAASGNRQPLLTQAGGPRSPTSKPHRPARRSCALQPGRLLEATPCCRDRAYCRQRICRPRNKPCVDRGQTLLAEAACMGSKGSSHSTCIRAAGGRRAFVHSPSRGTSAGGRAFAHGGSPGDIVIPWTAGRQCFSEGHLQGGRPAGSFGPAADFTKGRGTEDATWWAGLLAACAAQPPAAGAWRTSRAIPSATCVLEPPGGRPFTRPRSSGPGTSARTRTP